MVGEFLRFLIVEVMLVKNTLIVEDPLILGVDQSLFFNNFLETEERAKFLLNWP